MQMLTLWTAGWLACCSLAVSLLATPAFAEDEGQVMKLADGKLQLEVAKSWKAVKPRVRIIDFEFAVQAAEGDEKPGRVTVMGAGGSIEDNIDRWIGQFSQPDGGSSKDAAKLDKKAVAGQQVHLVDISGTFDDRPPFAGGGVKRPNYRMLAAIIETKQLGKYFVKFYGPAKTVAENKEAFDKMIASLKVAGQ